MAALTGPALVAAALLAMAGAQKVLDPAATVGALRQIGLPASASLVRAGAAAELGLGCWALVGTGPLPWLLVSASYLAFSGFVALALRRGTMIGSCGCFGREDTPPHWSHVVLDLALAVVAASVAVSADEAVVTALAGGGADAVGVLGLATVGTYLLYAAFVQLPRTLAAARDLRG